MNTYEMKHQVFSSTKQFDSDSPPNWLVSKEFLWFYTKHVDTLKVGESVETDFQVIKRLS